LYHSFYNLKEQPFRLTPDPAFMCMTANHQEALAGLVYSVCTRPGLTVLTGEAGTGKTTLLYALLDLLEKRLLIVAIPIPFVLYFRAYGHAQPGAGERSPRRSPDDVIPAHHPGS